MVGKDPFYTPEPTHYKFRVTVPLDLRSTFREVMRATKIALSDEFDRDTSKIDVHEIKFRYPGEDSQVLVSVLGLSTSDSLDDLEYRAKKAMVGEFDVDDNLVRAPCIDTLP